MSRDVWNRKHVRARIEQVRASGPNNHVRALVADCGRLLADVESAALVTARVVDRATRAADDQLRARVAQLEVALG